LKTFRQAFNDKLLVFGEGVSVMRLGLIGGVVGTAAVLSFLVATPAAATVRIVRDAGGQIGPYLESLVQLRSSGERVIIDGPCLSACTMVLGVIPRERICMTRRARLGFHAAWHPGENGQQIRSNGGTQLLMEVYPQNVRSWIASKGGLSERMLILHGRELAQMYPTCQTNDGPYQVQRRSR
jgi:hypothetical protein